MSARAFKFPTQNHTINIQQSPCNQKHLSPATKEKKVRNLYKQKIKVFVKPENEIQVCEGLGKKILHESHR